MTLYTAALHQEVRNGPGVGRLPDQLIFSFHHPKVSSGLLGLVRPGKALLLAGMAPVKDGVARLVSISVRAPPNPRKALVVSLWLEGFSVLRGRWRRSGHPLVEALPGQMAPPVDDQPA